MRNKLNLSYLVLIGYVLLMVAKMMLGGNLDGWDLLGAVVGAGVGFHFSWFDRVAYIYITHPEVQLSQQVAYWMKGREFKRAFEAIRDRSGEMDKLTTRSFLFQVSWVILTFFALTSIGSGFGKMLVMGLGLEIVFNQSMGYRKDREGLKRELFWQVKREVGDLELKRYVWAMSGVFILLSLMVR